jgi:hypothetical protein
MSTEQCITNPATRGLPLRLSSHERRSIYSSGYLDDDCRAPPAGRAEKITQMAGIAGANLHVAEARALAGKGVIVMASRYFPDHVELVVRPSMSWRADKERLDAFCRTGDAMRHRKIRRRAA